MRSILMKPKQMDPPLIKVLLTGDVGVGKTSFATRLSIPNAKDFHTTPTIGCEYSQLQRSLDVVHMWDISGNQKYESFFPLYVTKTNHIILFYDVGSKNSFLRLSDIFSKNIKSERRDFCIAVVGNKCDKGVDRFAVVSEADLDTFLSDIRNTFPNVSKHFISTLDDDISTLMKVLPPEIIREKNQPIQDNDTPIPGNLVCATVANCSLL